MSKWSVLILGATILAYLPAINNGFIADDYVILHRIELLKADPLYLFTVVPENFRLTSYAVFGAFKTLFGYDARPFYVFNILLHALNALLLRRVLIHVLEDEEWSNLTALLFAVFQAPQEAVMWLAAMNETLLSFFLLLSLLLWVSHRYVWSGVMFMAALFSKESALIFLAFVPLIDWNTGRRKRLGAYLYLLAPASVFAAVFLLTLSHNFQVENGTYALGSHAVRVLFTSLHTLMRPWGYLALALLPFGGKFPDSRRAVLGSLAVLGLLLPYVFVTYTNNIPSRQVYLASAVFLMFPASVMLRLAKPLLATAFVAFNVFYIWTVKDSQMVDRALPTTALVETLQDLPPGPLRVSHFAYPVEILARSAGASVRGWTWNDVKLGESCPGCVVLEWDAGKRQYTVRR